MAHEAIPKMWAILEWYQSLHPAICIANDDVGPPKGGVVMVVINPLRQEVQEKISCESHIV